MRIARAADTAPTVARRSANGNSRTIERATLVLTCFTGTDPQLRLPQIAEKLGLNVSTVYRYLATLEAAGLLTRDGRREGYRLGLRVIELAGIALNQIEVRKQALDELDRLCEEVGLLVNLGVLFEGDVLHIAHSAPKDVPRMYTTLGRRAVAHCTALGKAILASRPPAEARAVIERYGWRPYTARSIQDFERLDAELVATRERGYALDFEERRIGVACLASPIRDYSGKTVAALSVSAAAEKMTPDFQGRLLARVLEAAHRVSFRLGDHSSAAYL